jgi:hypothetical protein
MVGRYDRGQTGPYHTDLPSYQTIHLFDAPHGQAVIHARV